MSSSVSQDFVRFPLLCGIWDDATSRKDDITSDADLPGRFSLALDFLIKLVTVVVAPILSIIRGIGNFPPNYSNFGFIPLDFTAAVITSPFASLVEAFRSLGAVFCPSVMYLTNDETKRDRKSQEEKLNSLLHPSNESQEKQLEDLLSSQSVVDLGSNP